MKIRQNIMMGYLAVTAGVGCASSVANAAVVFYGNAGNHNLQADPIGVTFAAFGGAGWEVHGNYVSSWLLYNGSHSFTQGSDLGSADLESAGQAQYWNGGMIGGAVFGSSNYANISFNGTDGLFEAVAQFYFDGAGGGYLMAIATTNPIPNPQNLSAVGGPALTISAGKAMIDGAAVPEPTSLGLLALGAMGLAIRRQRRKAA